MNLTLLLSSSDFGGITRTLEWVFSLDSRDYFNVSNICTFKTNKLIVCLLPTSAMSFI